MNHIFENGTVDILAVRCPRDVKRGILTGSTIFQRSLTDTPMLIHLYFLRNVWFNYYNTIEAIRAPMFDEVRKSLLREASV